MRKVRFDRIKRRHSRRRRILRGLLGLAGFVAIASFLTVFTDNRLVDGVRIAAVAAAAPVALYLGLRSR